MGATGGPAAGPAAGRGDKMPEYGDHFAAELRRDPVEPLGKSREPEASRIEGRAQFYGGGQW